MALSSKFENLRKVIEDPALRDLAVLENLWRTREADTWAEHPEIYRLLSQKILKLGEPLLAYDVAAEGVRLFAKDVSLRQLLALALARSGAPGPANAILAELYSKGCLDEETLGLLARTHKDLASEAMSADESNRHMGKAYDFYVQAYLTTGGHWSGINAATLALILNKQETAEALARQVATLCKKKLAQDEVGSAERYWLISTLGEAALLLREWSEAEEWYGQAVALGRGDWGNLQSTRRNARLLMDRLGTSPPHFEQIFAFPNVVVFSGHMVDRPGRAIPRFPAHCEQAVQEEIRKRLKQLNVGFGYASAACGSDILFLEAILELKGEAHIFLPYEKESFFKESVEVIPGADWVKRAERVMAEAAEVQAVSQQSQNNAGAAFEFANLILHGLAQVRAAQLGTKLIPLAVWDGKTGDGLGGTATTVERWRKLGLEVEIIEVSKLIPHEAALEDRVRDPSQSVVERKPAEAATTRFNSEIRALLFADAEGFSKLTDEEVPRFVEHFLGQVGKLLAESHFQPLAKNTWGDGLYFVFANVRDAGQFALDLRDGVRGTDWQAKGLPNLNLRIGLHAGPVYACTDPVTGRPNYIGSHVSRAARIEPITPSGQVYASQAFAALAAAEGIKEFRCDYVGQTSMAKKYGTFPTYVVLRRRRNAF